MKKKFVLLSILCCLALCSCDNNEPDVKPSESYDFSSVNQDLSDARAYFCGSSFLSQIGNAVIKNTKLDLVQDAHYHCLDGIHTDRLTDLDLSSYTLDAQNVAMSYNWTTSTYMVLIPFKSDSECWNSQWYFDSSYNLLSFSFVSNIKAADTTQAVINNTPVLQTEPTNPIQSAAEPVTEADSTVETSLLTENPELAAYEAEMATRMAFDPITTTYDASFRETDVTSATFASESETQFGTFATPAGTENATDFTDMSSVTTITSDINSDDVSYDTTIAVDDFLASLYDTSTEFITSDVIGDAYSTSAIDTTVPASESSDTSMEDWGLR